MCTVEPLLSVSLYQLWSMLIRACTVRYFGRDPHWFRSVFARMAGLTQLSTTNSSPTLERIEVREMGLRCLLASLTGEVFGRGVMSAFFHQVGRWCSKKEEFNESRFSFSTQEGIPSGPDALFMLSTNNFLGTESSDIGWGGSCWCMYACVCTSGKARGVNALIGAKKGIINNIGQVFRIFPLISKVLKVCDGAGTLDFRKAT